MWADVSCTVAIVDSTDEEDRSGEDAVEAFAWLGLLTGEERRLAVAELTIAAHRKDSREEALYRVIARWTNETSG